MEYEISLGDIKKLTSQTIFERGDEYYQDDLIHSTYKIGPWIKGGCTGSQGSSYLVEACFQMSGSKTIIKETNCSCPYGSLCKHIVALLLKWHYKPNSFKDTQDLVKYLSKKEKDQLVEFILDFGKEDLNIIGKLYEMKDGLKRRKVTWYVDFDDEYDPDFDDDEDE